MPQKYFQVEGVATFLHHTGATTLPGTPPATSRGRVILCLHGAGGNGAQFAGLLEALAHDHSPIAFDFPGHGRSGGLDSLASVPLLAAFTGALIEKLALPAPLLVGHELGGAVALELALDNPERITGVLLVGSGAHREDLDAAIAQLERVSAGKERRPFQRERYAKSAASELLRRGFAEELKTDPRAKLGALRALRDFDARSRLNGLRVPAWAVAGSDESPEVKAEVERFAAAVSGCRSVVIADAAAMLPFEQPAALAQLARDFAGALP